MHQLQNTNLNLKHYEYGVVAFYVNLKNCSAQNINYSLNLYIKTEILQIKKTVKPAFDIKWGETVSYAVASCCSHCHQNMTCSIFFRQHTTLIKLPMHKLLLLFEVLRNMFKGKNSLQWLSMYVFQEFTFFFFIYSYGKISLELRDVYN
jgi:hypothetical protein